MTVLWAVPLLAVVVALVLLLSQLRALEDLSTDLVRAVRRSAELRGPLRAVRREIQRSDALVDRLQGHWDVDTDGIDPGAPGDGSPPPPAR